MFQRVLGRVIEAFAAPGAHPEAGDALCKATQELHHHGAVEILNNFPTEDRKFSAHNADVLLRPAPPGFFMPTYIRIS